MVDQTAEEFEKKNICKMGAALGAMYSALWQEVAVIYVNWKDYVELFGTKPSRIDLLNRAAPAFFRMIQDELWNMALLHICRLTDAPNVAGRSNLTVRALPDLVADANLKAELTKLVNTAVENAKFCRDWRNRRIAHNDRALALDQPTVPLAEASRAGVAAVLDSLAAVLNAIDGHFFDSETRFDIAARLAGAMSLLRCLHRGVKAEDELAKRLERGEFSNDDLDPADL
jgi:hypothetical protein